MKNTLMMTLSLLSLFSCEKIWVEDLQEKAYDTIRGTYEIESIVWEGTEPIDIDGDGEASFDYLAEWNRVYSGGPGWNVVTNERGTLDIPYVVDNAKEWGGYASLTRWHDQYKFDITAVVEGNDFHLEFSLPDRPAELAHAGYGEITLRTEVTLDVLAEPDRSKEVHGTIFIKYVRTEYRSE